MAAMTHLVRSLKVVASELHCSKHELKLITAGEKKNSKKKEKVRKKNGLDLIHVSLPLLQCFQLVNRLSHGATGKEQRQVSLEELVDLDSTQRACNFINTSIAPEVVN